MAIISYHFFHRLWTVASCLTKGNFQNSAYFFVRLFANLFVKQIMPPRIAWKIQISKSKLQCRNLFFLIAFCGLVMSDTETTEVGGDEKLFYVDRAKGTRAGCKKCKDKIETGTLRIAKFVSNPFGEGKMKHWYHVPCIFEAFTRQRATTPKIQSTEDIEGWVTNLSHQDRLDIIAQFPDYVKVESNPTTGPAKPEPKKRAKKKADDSDGELWTPTPSPAKASTSSRTGTPKKGAASSSHEGFSQTQSYSDSQSDKPNKDDLFREFRRLCADVANENSYLKKTEIIHKALTDGVDGNGFKGDLLLWCRLLLPGVIKRVYNLQAKALIKLFSRLFGTDQDEMLEDLEQGDIAETIKIFFDKSLKLKPAKKSLLTLQEVDEFLDQLSSLTKEDDQLAHFKQFALKCTSNDLKMVIRLIKGDLRINAGAKPILTAVHEDAYQAFQASQDIESVIREAMQQRQSSNSSKKMNIGVSLLTPVLPMLAEACKSVDMAMKKCPNGMYSEIKYDGERVQVHKQGNEFKYFSRSLKPVLPHKVNHFKDHIPKAFPHGKDLILDAEVLMIDLKTGQPLPFGSLGKHKRNDYADANVCLFVFDCMYFNGESLMHKPIKERKKILKYNMKEIPNHIVFSELEEIHEPKELENMISKVLKLGLEGLVLKDLNSPYEPGKRHWLKVKKDYLFGGKMADSADLLVLGAWYGTGQRGGMMSIFLMGCRDPAKNIWCTVTKVHTGHDDKTLEKLQTELAPNMKKISKDQAKVPSWMRCTKTMVPDFVAIDPKLQPVWEITGAEFTQHDVHTADGISIRFPRVTRIRSDKNWETATTLPELKTLFENSKSSFSDHLFGESSAGGASNSTTPVHSDDESRDATTPSKSPRKAVKDSPIKGSPRGKRGQDSNVTPKKNEMLDNFLFRKKTGDNSGATSKERSVSPAKDSGSPSRKKKKLESEFEGKKDKYLLDIFEGVKMELPKKDIPDYDTLYRYFVAFGGEVLPTGAGKEDRTHVLKTHLTKGKGLTVPLVEVSWLWDSIKLQKQQDTANYLAY